MSTSIRSAIGGATLCFVFLLLLGIASPGAFAQLPPKVINTGVPCVWEPPNFLDPMLQGSRCWTFRYDFDGCSFEGHPLFFQLHSGPGVIDSATGIWTWPNVPASAVGQTFTVRVRAWDAVDHYFGFDVAMSVTVFHTPPVISSGCQSRTALTGEPVQAQLAIGQSECDPIFWHTTQLLGPGSAQYSVDATGKLDFTAVEPGVYLLRTLVSDSVDADSCDITYVVHGGAPCCVGARGNVNAKGIVDSADLSTMVAYLTTPYVVLGCYDAANVNGVGVVDSGDLAVLVSYLTGAGAPVAACP